MIARALAFVFFALLAGPVGASPLVTITPRNIPQGGVALVRVASDTPLGEASAAWSGRGVSLFRSGEELLGLLGVDVEMKPGMRSLKIRGAFTRGSGFVIQTSFRVVSKEFPVQRLTLPSAMVTPPKRVLGRILKEKRLLDSIFAKISSRRYFRGGFTRPVPGVITSPFGTRRILNRLPRSRHSGVDMKAGEGDEVRCANSGVVVLAQEFYYSGNAVIIDHGLGLYSMYFHLSRILVKEGERVEKRTLLGLAGATGRSTGPHLHFGVRLTGARVDPELLLKLKAI